MSCLLISSHVRAAPKKKEFADISFWKDFFAHRSKQEVAKEMHHTLVYVGCICPEVPYADQRPIDLIFPRPISSHM